MENKRKITSFEAILNLICIGLNSIVIVSSINSIIDCVKECNSFFGE